VAPDSQVEFERLVGTAKHPLRIDIRHNDANPAVLEGTLESAMLNPNQFKGVTGMMSSSNASANEYSEDNNEVAVGLWSPSGLIDTVRLQSQQKGGNRPSSALTRRAQQGEQNQTRPPVRPQSAIVGGRDRSQSPAVGGLGVSVGARALMRPVGGHGDDDERDGSDMETPRSARRPLPTEEHGGLIAMIESGAKARSLNGGSNGGAGDAVGSILDESIRSIQEQVPSSETKGKKKKKKSVNETILTDTKRVYVNKMHFPGEDEALAVIEARKRASQAALSAGGGGGGGPREREDARKRPSTAGVSPQGEVKGGGAASALAASAIRNRINAAKEQESKLAGAAQPTRPHSAAVSASSSKKSSAHTLMSGIQRLNPASLF